MGAVVVQLIVIGLGLLWLTFVVLVNRKHEFDEVVTIVTYGVGVVLVGYGLLFMPVVAA